MAGQNQTIHTQPEHKNGHKTKPVVLPQQISEPAAVGELTGEFLGTNEDGMQGQSMNLCSAPMQTIQRQRLAVQIGQMHGNQHLQRVVQRQAGEVAGPAALIAEDEAETLQPGQMRKSAFLARLKESSCAAADEALSGTIYSTVGCPYITKVFGKLPGYPSAKIERMIRTYAPETAGATTAEGYITPVTNRMRSGIARWLASGEIPALPEGLSSLGDMGSLEQVGASGTGLLGQAVSAVGNLFFKARPGGANLAEDPEAIQAQLGPGRALDSEVKSKMGAAFGYDFSSVRQHTDSRANQVSDDLHARAFTVENDVAFGSDEYHPGTPVGDALIAHELAHVVQQRGASYSSRPLSKGDGRYTALEEEADLSAVGAIAYLWSGAKGQFVHVAQNALPSLRSGLRLQRCKSDEREAEREAAQRITKGGYTTYLVSIPGDQKFIVQFYRRPDATEGAMLRFKADTDTRPPAETPIPAGATFNPTIIRESNDLVTFSFSGSNQADLTIHIAAGKKVGHHDAINPDRPYGPLRMEQEFEEKFVEALITHPGGSEKYSWTGGLPDEAVAPPTWQMTALQGGYSGRPGYRAVRGKYQGRFLMFGKDINEGERAAVHGFKAGTIAAVKFMASLAVYSIPYVGPLVFIGEAVVGKTIWGDKLSTEERVAFGLLALIPVARAARSAAAESRAAADLAATRGISQAEALTLIRGAKAFTAGESAFVESATTKIKAGEALTEAEATRLAQLLNKIGTQEKLIFSGANDIEMIWTSQRYWGKTEGAVYGARLPVTTALQRLKAMIGRKEGLVVFQGEAAELFHAHEIEGGYSAMKRLLGQQKSGFGDIIFDQAVKEGNTIVVTRAHLATAAEVQHAGQTTSWALARLWGRRLLLEPVGAAGMGTAGYGVYMLYEWLTD